MSCYGTGTVRYLLDLLEEVDEEDGKGVRGEGSLGLPVQLRYAGPVAECYAQGSNPAQKKGRWCIATCTRKIPIGIRVIQI